MSDSARDRFHKVMDMLNLTDYRVYTDIEGITKNMMVKLRNGETEEVSIKILSPFCRKFENVNPDYILTGRGDPLKKQEKACIIADYTKGSSIQESFPFEYDYKVIDFFKDYYSYLNYQEIEPNILDKQLTTLTEEESAKIAGIMKLDYEDFTRGIEIVTGSTHTGKLVPVYNAKAAAGNANVDMYGSRTGWVNVGDLLKDSEASLYVYGNSMIPGYPPGSLIGIRPLNESFIEPGSVYVVQTESNRYIKRLYYNKDKTALICMSDNHIKHADGPMEGDYFYPPFEIPIPAIKIIYKVTGVIKRNSVSST